MTPGEEVEFISLQEEADREGIDISDCKTPKEARKKIANILFRRKQEKQRSKIIIDRGEGFHRPTDQGPTL